MRISKLAAPASAYTNRLNNRQRILEFALQVFAEYGFSGASTREIARRAGVHQPIIVYYFKNKEQLWRESVEFAFTDLLATMLPVAKNETDPDKRLWYAANAFVRGVARRPEWAALMVHEGLQSHDRNRWMIETWVIPLTRVVYKSLTGRKWPAKGSPLMVQAQSLIAVLGGSTTIFAQRVLALQMSGVDISSEQFIQTHVETYRLMLKGIMQPPLLKTHR